MSIKNTPYRSCFLHFFDIHFLSEFKKKSFDKELVLATKIAILCSDSIILPLASYYENLKCRKIIQKIQREIGDYNIRFIGNARTPEEFANAKLVQYEEGSEQYKIYEKISSNGEKKKLHIIRKNNSTTGFIKSAWEDKIRTGILFKEFVSLRKKLPQAFEETALNLHEVLDGRAYTPEYINKALFGNCEESSPCTARTTCIINREYFSSYLQELPQCAVVTELDTLDSQYLETYKYNLHIPYKSILRSLFSQKFLIPVYKMNYKDLCALKDDDTIMAKIGVAIEKYCKTSQDYQHLTTINNNTYINNGDAVQFGNNNSIKNNI